MDKKWKTKAQTQSWELLWMIFKYVTNRVAILRFSIGCRNSGAFFFITRTAKNRDGRDDSNGELKSSNVNRDGTCDRCDCLWYCCGRRADLPAAVGGQPGWRSQSQGQCGDYLELGWWTACREACGWIHPDCSWSSSWHQLQFGGLDMAPNCWQVWYNHLQSKGFASNI